jgi:hypothetical protein
MRQESDRAMENLFKNYQNTVILNNQISISMNGRVWVMFLFIIMLNFARWTTMKVVPIMLLPPIKWCKEWLVYLATTCTSVLSVVVIVNPASSVRILMLWGQLQNWNGFLGLGIVVQSTSAAGLELSQGSAVAAVVKPVSQVVAFSVESLQPLEPELFFRSRRWRWLAFASVISTENISSDLRKTSHFALLTSSLQNFLLFRSALFWNL